jgi:hypothetical protein
LNFAFATAPLGPLTKDTKQASVKLLFDRCYYVVYETNGELFHFVYLSVSKQDYYRCITESVLQFLLYGEVDVTARNNDIALVALSLLLSRSDNFDLERSRALREVGEIMSQFR